MATAATEVDPISRGNSLRRKNLLQKNLIHKSEQNATCRHLDAQKKYVQAQLSKEEKELRAQLQRLQLEQRSLAQSSYADLGNASFTSIYVDDSEHYNGEPEEVVNPYPVTIGRHRTRKISAPCRQGPSNTGLSLYQRRRRGSVEFEDLELHSASGKFQLPHLPRTSSTRNVLVLPPTPTDSLPRTDSMWSLKSASPADKDERFWAGDPEAISSVRRPRKTPGRQKAEHSWTRSQSLKERPSKLRPGSSTSSLVSRSSSMRDSAIRSPQPPLGTSPQPHEQVPHAWTRSRSLKESRRAARSQLSSPDREEGSPIPIISARSNRPRSIKARSRLGGSSQSSKISLAELGTSPETKSTVWGFQDDELNRSSSLLSASSASVASTVRSRRRSPHPDTSAPVTILLDGAPPPLPPISPSPGEKELSSSPPAQQQRKRSVRPRARKPPRSPLAVDDNKPDDNKDIDL